MLAGKLPVHANVCTDYISQNLSAEYKKSIHVEQKSEYIDKYEDYLGKVFISSIAVSYTHLTLYGDAKLEGLHRRGKKIKYICLMEDYSKPVWGYVIQK